MKQKIDVFYIEDNEDYIQFVGRAVKKISTELVYDYVTDGHGAIDYFENKCKDKSAIKMILLDINLPGMNGFELLKKIRAIEGIKYIPVIMFSTSDNPEDVKASYENGANAYLVKPSGLAPLVDTLKSVCDFWLGLNSCYN